MKAQSPFTALISTAVLVGILLFSIMQVSLISGRIAEEERSRKSIDALLEVSNDLLSNPGYNGTSLDWQSDPEHIGLAEYDAGRKIVLDHVLDAKKMAFLQKEGAGLIERQYEIGNASLRIETLSGDLLMETGGGLSSRIQVSRLALIKKGEGYERVRLVFALEA